MVSPLHGVLDSKIDDVTPYLAKISSINLASLCLLGIVDYHDLVSRVLFGKLSQHHSRKAADYESARESCDRPASLQIPDTGTVVRRRLASRFCTSEVDGLDHETRPVRPRAVSVGWTMPKSRIFEVFSMSTGGRTSKPRRSLFGYFERKAA